ncbi:MAG: DNA polymerase III subunit delta [Sedimentisphaerales bacterium]|nr:DNA polymerase III subunit delta [Sedimentisphaerales bacterium]
MVRQAAKKEVTIAPVTVIYGKERRLVTDQLEEIIDIALEGADPQLALSRYDGDTVELADVLDDLRTTPFLSPRRVVVVRDAGDFISKYREALEAYVERPSPTGVLILTPDSFPSNTRLAKAVAKSGNVIACEPVKRYELPAFLNRYAQDHYGLTLGRDAANMLIELTGTEVGLLEAEIDKLAAYVNGPEGPGKAIRLEDVIALTGQNRQLTVFEVIDAMTAGEAGTALTGLERMLNQDRNAQFTAVGAFAWHVRRLYDARLLLDAGISKAEIPRKVRVWSQPDVFMRQVSHWHIEDIGALLGQLLEIDLAAKTGGDLRTALELLIVNFCHRPRGVA